MESIKQVVNDIVKQVRHTEVSPEEEGLPFRDIGIDSLEVANVFLMVEEHFGIKIPDEEVDRLRSIQAVAQYVKDAGGR